MKSTIKPSALDFERPLTTVDVVIFAVMEGTLRVLLVRRADSETEPFPGHWALPGGFVDVSVDPSLEACAFRKLKEKTGLAQAYLEQLGSWGDATRDPRGWSATHVFFSLVSSEALKPVVPGANAVDAAWVEIKGNRICDPTKLPLAFDHGSLLSSALDRLRSKVEYTSLPAFLMPKEFTLNELQQTFEVVLDRTLDKTAFRRRVQSTELLVPVPRLREASNRPAQLFRLRSTLNPVYFARTFRPE